MGPWKWEIGVWSHLYIYIGKYMYCTFRMQCVWVRMNVLNLNDPKRKDLFNNSTGTPLKQGFLSRRFVCVGSERLLYIDVSFSYDPCMSYLPTFTIDWLKGMCAKRNPISFRCSALSIFDDRGCIDAFLPRKKHVHPMMPLGLFNGCFWFP